LTDQGEWSAPDQRAEAGGSDGARPEKAGPKSAAADDTGSGSADSSSADPGSAGRPQDPTPPDPPSAPPPQYNAPPYNAPQDPQYSMPQYPGAPHSGPQYAPPPQYGMPRYAPKPGVIPLRPLSFGEILDGSISTIRAYPKQMLGLSALVSTVTNLLVVGIAIYMFNETDLLTPSLPPFATENDVALENLRLTFVLALPALVLSVLARMFLGGLLTIVIGKAVLGQPVTLGEAWRRVAPRFGALLVVSILFTLLVAAATFVFVIPGIWLYVLFSLASTALILEGAKVGRSFGRSRALVRGAWWRTFGVLLVALIITAILQNIVQIPVNLLDGGLNRLTGSGPVPGLELGLLLSAVGGILAETITQPFTCGVTTLVYLDRRMRREGMDIELARQAGAAPPEPGGPSPVQPAW
jgi:hypothetical protein